MWLILIILVIIIPLLWIMRKNKTHLIFLILISGLAISSLIIFISPFKIGPEVGSYTIYMTSNGCMNKSSITNPLGLWKYNHRAGSIDDMGIAELIRCGQANMASKPAPTKFYILLDLFLVTLLLYLIYILYKMFISTQKWLKMKVESNPNFFKFKIK